MKKAKTTWDFSSIFDGDQDPKIIERRKLDEKNSYSFINKWKDRTDHLSDPKILKTALDEYDLWMRETGVYNNELYYFELRTQQDQTDTKLKGAFNQIVDLATKLQNEIQFFSMRIAKIPAKNQNIFLNDPDLKDYKHFLENLFENSKHQLSEPEEKIMNLKSQTSHSNWTKMVSTFISEEERQVAQDDGTKALKNFSDLGPLLFSQNKTIRDSAAEAINDVLLKHSSIAEQEMNSIMANKKVDDELRGFPRPDSASHMADDIETEVVDTLLKAVAEKFTVSRRWYALKAKLLGVPKLEYHERMVEFGVSEKSYSYDESRELVSSVFTKLDPEFGKIFDGFVNNGQIDVFPKKGKQGGAFCAALSVNLPTYILLNHAGTFNDVSTLAHEAGHGINDELMKSSQNALNFDSPLSTAEVASTFMEDFVTAEVIDGADEELKLSMMIKKMDDDVATIYRQTACYLFEQELHSEFRKKGYLSKIEIGKIFQKHMADYMGPAVEQSAGSENWWVYWSHIRAFFYVYSYVSGLLISKYLQKSVREDHGFIPKVKQFLAAGASASPRDIFSQLGVNIAEANFWSKGLLETEDLLQEIEVLAKKLGKIS
jgi:oligoendopeptidase F